MEKRIYFPAIDGLRFLAFVLVFFQHFEKGIPRPFLHRLGWTGVELFFLISAFLLTRLLVTEYRNVGHIDLKKFYLRRIFRIWPLYFAYLFLVVGYTLINHGTQSFSWLRFAGNVLFADNLLTAFYGYNPNIFSYHLWSISLEEQFYIILPFLIPWMVRQPLKKLSFFLLSVFVIMLTARAIASAVEAPRNFIYVLPISGDCFLIGIVLGMGYFDNYLKKLNPFACIFAAMLSLYLAYELPSKSEAGLHQVYLYTLIAIAFALLLIAVVYSGNQLLKLLFENKLIRYLGKISYGLYIFHLGGLHIAGIISDRIGITSLALRLLLSFIITMIAALTSYEMFEKYFLRKKKAITVIKNRPD